MYCLSDNKIENIVTKIWSGVISGYIVNFSLTYSSADIDNVKFSEYLNEAHEVIKSFKVVEPEYRQEKITSYILTSFLKGIAASMVILNNAVEHKAFIEAACIIATQVDAFLKIGIVLKSQLINRNNEIAKNGYIKELVMRKYQKRMPTVKQKV